MSTINWDSQDLTISDILEGFLGNVDDDVLEYREDDISNPLAQELIRMVETTSFSETNITNLIRLDDYGVVGKKLVNLWYLCEENPEYFSKTISYMTGTFLSRCFTQDEVEKNMDLDEPIEFIPNSELVPFFSELQKSDKYDSSVVEDIVYTLRMNLVNKYNAKVKEEGLNYSLLEIPKKKIDQEKRLDDNVVVDPKRLYFGLNTIDLSGGVLGINMQTYGLFERTMVSIKIGSEQVFLLKEIPDGDMVAIDKNGNLVQLDQEVSYEGGTLLPNKKFVHLSVGPLSLIMEDAKKRCLDNEVISKYDELIRNGATVLDCENMLSDLAHVYSTLYGGIDKNRGL